MHFSYIDEFSKLSVLEEEWRDLEIRSRCTVFQSFAFIKSWIKCVATHEAARPAVIIYREKEILKGVFPAGIVSKYGVRVMTWLGGLNIVDYGDVLFDDASSISRTDFIRRAFVIFREKGGHQFYNFYNVRQDSASFRYLSEKCSVLSTNVAPFIPVKDTFESYLEGTKKFRKKTKSDTLRQIRRLNEIGTLEFHVVEPGHNDIDSIMKRFYTQKKRNYSERAAHGVLFRNGYEDFYRDQMDNDDYHLVYLTLNDEIIAIHCGYLYQNIFYYLMPSYCDKYEKYSPGRILMYYLLELCFKQGVSSFDFCIGSDQYKYEWTNEAIPTTSFVNKGFRGNAVKTAQYVRKLLKNIVALRYKWK